MGVDIFFFKQKTAYEMRISDWSSDVCSSDLRVHRILARALKRLGHRDRHAVNARIAELLHLVRLPPDAAARFPHELSGCQRQRVAISRAFAREPEMNMADGPGQVSAASVQAGVVNPHRRQAVQARSR